MEIPHRTLKLEIMKKSMLVVGLVVCSSLAFAQNAQTDQDANGVKSTSELTDKTQSEVSESATKEMNTTVKKNEALPTKQYRSRKEMKMAIKNGDK